MFKYGLDIRWYFETILFLAVIMVIEVCRQCPYSRVRNAIMSVIYFQMPFIHKYSKIVTAIDLKVEIQVITVFIL